MEPPITAKDSNSGFALKPRKTYINAIIESTGNRISKNIQDGCLIVPNILGYALP